MRQFLPPFRQHAVVAVVLVVLIAAPVVEAQSASAARASAATAVQRNDEETITSAATRHSETITAYPIRNWIERAPLDLVPDARRSQVVGIPLSTVSAAAQRGYRGRRHGDRRLAGLVLGAIGGAAAGGAIGVAVTDKTSCNCDNPTLHGFLIGAPIGAFVGGLLGYAIAR